MAMATDLVLLGPGEDAVKVGSPLDVNVGDVGGHVGGSSVSGGDKDVLDEGRLDEFPGESMFPPSGSEEEDSGGVVQGRGRKGMVWGVEVVNV